MCGACVVNWVYTELLIRLLCVAVMCGAFTDAGKRGLVLVQLWNGWAPDKGQPLHQPLTAHMLARVLNSCQGKASSINPLSLS